MMASARTHPATLYARMHNGVSLILKVGNPGPARWVEAEIRLPEKLSLAPDTHLNKGRIRVGIVNKGEELEKSVKIYASAYTDAQLYLCKATVFSYDRDGVIDERLEVPFSVKCEEQQPAVL